MALTVGLVGLGHSARPLRWKRWLIGGVLIAGVAGFGISTGFFRRKETAWARGLLYWRAAGIIIQPHPLFGTGPGTFSIPYAEEAADENGPALPQRLLGTGVRFGYSGVISYTAMIFGGFCSLIDIDLAKIRELTAPILWLGCLGRAYASTAWWTSLYISRALVANVFPIWLVGCILTITLRTWLCGIKHEKAWQKTGFDQQIFRA